MNVFLTVSRMPACATLADQAMSRKGSLKTICADSRRTVVKAWV